MDKNLILCDCKPIEIKDFCEAMEQYSHKEFTIHSCVTNRLQGNLFSNILRFFLYFVFPLFVYLKKKNPEIVIGWQQFYAINYAFFSKLFHAKRAKVVVVLFFTYKKKRGLAGLVYKKYIEYVMRSQYVDYVHVLGMTYAKECSIDLGIPLEKFIVSHFGFPDIYSKISILQRPFDNNYCLSIGRSNRDFDFLVNLWKQEILSKHQLIIISDTWKSKTPLPENIHHLDNVKGEAAYPWIANCEAMIIPIDDGNICSGDTVLLMGMMAQKPVVITEPSTLAEMYIKDKVDGICISKDINNAAQIIAEVLDNKELKENIGRNARNSYICNYSRHHMGETIAKNLFEIKK